MCQISFEEPIVLASCSRKHDTHPLILQTRRFAVSILAADQVEIGQYFSYPGRRFRYMAPEYASGEDPSPASDQYSLAVVCFEMLTGELPYTAATPLAVLLAHVAKKPPMVRFVGRFADRHGEGPK